MSEKYNGYKYKTLEQKQEADKERKRLWAAANRKSYQETIKNMTVQEYQEFVQKNTERVRKHRKNIN